MLDVIVAHEGEIVQTIGVDAGQITARFRDPSRNVIGLYQRPVDASALPHIARGPSRFVEEWCLSIRSG